MPDLNLKAVHQFWREYPDPMIYRVLSFMEAVEHDTYIDHPEIKTALERFGNALENVKEFQLKNEEHYIRICSHLHMTQLLRILQTIDTVSPGSASKVLMYAEENSHRDETINFFLRRNIVFERLRLLARVFAPDRLALLNKVLEGEEYD